MTLEDVIKRFEHRTLFIGSQSGFFWIGDGVDARFAMKCLSKKFLSERKKSRTKNNKLLKVWMNKRGNFIRNKEDGELKNVNLSIAKMMETQDRLEESIRNFKPLLEREVKDVYVRHKWLPTDILGIIVVVEGDERGEYWDNREFDDTRYLCK